MDYKRMIQAFAFIWESMVMAWDFHDHQMLESISGVPAALLEMCGVYYKDKEALTPEEKLLVIIATQTGQIYEEIKKNMVTRTVGHFYG